MSDIDASMSVEGVEKIDLLRLSIEKLTLSIETLGNTSSLNKLNEQMQLMQASITTGFAELGANTVRQIQKNSKTTEEAIEAAGRRMKEADARTWQQIQDGSAANVARAFHGLAQGIPVEEVAAKLGQIAATTAQSLDGDVAKLKQFQTNTQSLWETHWNTLAGANEAQLLRAQHMNQEFDAKQLGLREAFWAEMLRVDAKRVEFEDTLNHRRLQDELATNDKLLEADIASENARAATLKKRIEFEDTLNHMRVQEELATNEKLLEADIASENARAATLKKRIELEDTLNHQREAAHLASLERQRVQDTNFINSSLAQQLAAAQKAATLKSLGGDATAQYGGAAAGANIAALQAQIAATNELAGANARLVPAIKATNIAQIEQNALLNDARGVFKGAAHEVGLYGLAHGQLITMIAGGALAAGLHHIAVMGAEVEYNLQFLKSLGKDQSPVDIDKFINISSGTLSNLHAAAEGVRAFAQAGFTAHDAMAALPDILRLSALGEMNVAQAAEMAVETMHAFGKEAYDLQNIGDVLVGVASQSNVSVHVLSEGLKSAATTGQMLGLTFEELTASVALMERRGLSIQPLSSALMHLQEPTDKMKKNMASLGIETKRADETFTQFAVRLSDGINSFNNTAAAIARITSNPREARAIQALTSDVQALLEIEKIAGESGGKMFNATLSQMDTVEGAFKVLSSTVQGDFVKAFEVAKPVIHEVELALLEIAQGKGVTETLGRIATGFAQFTKILVDNGTAIASLMVAYAGVKMLAQAALWVKEFALAQGAATLAVTSNTLAVTVNMEALQAEALMLNTLTVAERNMALGAEVAAVAVTGLQRAFGPIAIALTIAAAAYSYFHDILDKDESKQLTVQNSVKNTLEAYRKEEERLDGLIDVFNRTGKAGVDAAHEIEKANARLNVAQAEQGLKKATSEYQGNASVPIYGHILQNRMEEAAATLAQARADEIDTATRQGNVKILSVQAKAVEEMAQAKEKLHKIPTSIDQIKGQPADVVEGFKKRAAALSAEAVWAKNAEDHLLKVKALEDDIKKSKRDVPDKPDTKGSNDALNAAIQKNALAKELLAVQQKTSMLELDKGHKSGAIGEINYLRQKNALEVASVDASVDQARADIALVEGVKNKQAATQKYENQVLVGNEKRKQLAIQLGIEEGAVFERMAQQELKFDAQTYAAKGQNAEAFLADYEATWNKTLTALADDMEIDDNEQHKAAYQRFLAAQEKMHKAGLAGAQAKDMQLAFNNAFDAVELRVSELAEMSKGSAGLSAIFDNAMASQEAYAAELDGLIVKQAELAKLAADNPDNPTIKKDSLDESKKIEAMQARMRAGWVEVGQTIGKSLTEAFGKGGTALGGLISAEIAYGQKRQQIQDQFNKADKSSPEKLVEAQKKADSERLSSSMATYADMAGAAKGFFKESSTGYQLMANAEKAFRIAEIALTLKSLAVKLFSAKAATTAEGEYTASSLVGSALRAAADGVAAVAKAIASLPFPANLAAGAATLAALVAVGVKMTGGGASAPTSSAARQDQAGAGSVLGSPTLRNEKGEVTLVGAKSESITKSLAILERDSGLGLAHSSAMVDSLRTIANGISGLSSVVVRTSGLTGNTAPDTLGSQQNLFKSVLGNQSIGEKLSHGLLGKIVGNIFGGATSVTDTGLSISSGSLGNIAAHGVTSSQYTDTKTTGGIFGSDKYSTQIKAMGSEVNDQFSKVILGLEDSILENAKSLGIAGDDFKEEFEKFKVSLDPVSLKGLTGDQIQKQFEAVFSKLGDDMAKFGVKGLEQFQKVGEGYFETLSRVANDLVQVKDVFMVLGKSTDALKGTDGVRISEGLVAAAGGIDKLTSNTKSFIEGFLTDSERIGPIAASVKTELGKLGQSTDMTAEQFKALVQAQDLNSASGQKMYTSLVALAPAFKAVDDHIQKIASTRAGILTDTKALTDPTGARDDKRSLEYADLAKLDPALAQLKKDFYAASDAVETLSVQQSLEIALANAQGDTIKATSIQRTQELDSLRQLHPELVALKQAGFDAADAVSALSKSQAFEVSVLRVQGKAYEADELTKANTLALLEKLNPEEFKRQKILDAAAKQTQIETEVERIHTSVLKAQGNELQIQKEARQKEYEVLRKLNPILETWQKELDKLEDKIAHENNLKSIEIQLAELSGNAAAVLAKKREDEFNAMAALDPVAAAYLTTLHHMQDAMALVTKSHALDIESMKAQGRARDAELATREDELVALQKLQPELVEYQRLIFQQQDQTAIANQYRAMEIELLQAQGDAQGAENLTRQDAIAALEKISPLLGAMRKEIYLAADATKLINFRQTLQDAIFDTKVHAGPQGGESGAIRQQELAIIRQISAGNVKDVKAAQQQLKELDLARIRAEGTERQAAYLSAVQLYKDKEASLWSQLATSKDPVAIAAKLQTTIIARIKAEATAREDAAKNLIALEMAARKIQEDALTAQISTLQSVKKMTEDITQFVSTTKFSDISPMNYKAQLSEAQKLYEMTLAKAKAGDVTAQGNLTGNAKAYLDEARQYFASSGAYASIFHSVMDQVGGLAVSNDVIDPQIVIAQSQLEVLQSLDGAQSDLQNAVNDTSAEEVIALGHLEDIINGMIGDNQSQQEALLIEIKKLHEAFDQAQINSKAALEQQAAISKARAEEAEKQRAILQQQLDIERAMANRAEAQT